MPNQADVTAMHELKTGSPQSAGRGFERAPGVMMAAQPASPLHSPPVPDAPTPLFYWRSLWRWKLWLIGLVLAGATLGISAARLRTPTYCAHTVLRPISAPEVVSQFSFAGSLLGMGGKARPTPIAISAYYQPSVPVPANRRASPDRIKRIGR